MAVPTARRHAARSNRYRRAPRRETRVKLGELQGELKLMLGAILLQTLVILGGVAVLLRLFA